MVDEQTGYDDEHDRVDREDDRIREQRWADFVSWARQGRIVVLLRHVSDIMEGFSDPFRVYPAIAEILSGFAETEGWDGVLTAIARAYREEQDAQ